MEADWLSVKCTLLKTALTVPASISASFPAFSCHLGCLLLSASSLRMASISSVALAQALRHCMAEVVGPEMSRILILFS